MYGKAHPARRYIDEEDKNSTLGSQVVPHCFVHELTSTKLDLFSPEIGGKYIWASYIHIQTPAGPYPPPGIFYKPRSPSNVYITVPSIPPIKSHQQWNACTSPTNSKQASTRYAVVVVVVPGNVREEEKPEKTKKKTCAVSPLLVLFLFYFPSIHPSIRLFLFVWFFFGPI